MSPHARLPPCRSILPVVAHPDDEPFALGALAAATDVLGLDTVRLLHYPDGRLPACVLAV